MTREMFIAALESIRRVMCTYANPRNCDCKYGAHHGIELHARGSTIPRGEVTGCCELREMVDLLLHVTDNQFNELVSKGNFAAMAGGFGVPEVELDRIMEKYHAGVHVPDWQGTPDLANLDKYF